MWLLLLLAPPSSAQQVTNTRTGTVYPTIGEAIGAAVAGDTLSLAGTAAEAITIDRDLTLLGEPDASITVAATNLVTVNAGVTFTLDGVDLSGIGNTRGVSAVLGGAALTVRNVTFDTGTTLDGQNGGGMEIIDPVSVDIENVTFVGTSGQRMGVEGGAIYVASNAGPSPVDLTDVVFDRTVANNGGAIEAYNVTLTCLRCRFDHTEGGFGGAFYGIDGTAEIVESKFCATTGSLGSAIFGSGTTEIRATVFQECTASLRSLIYTTGGDWTIVNNHVIGSSDRGNEVILAGVLAESMEVTNNLFYGNVATALQIDTGIHTIRYNWFDGNDVDSNLVLDATNTTGLAPDLASWTADGDCDDDELWPRPVVSPLLDAGDPVITDPDGTRSDIGAFGGPDADPYYHTDHDGDGPSFLLDCDDGDGANFPGNPEVCDAADNNCDTDIDEDPIDLDTFHEDCDGDGQGAPTGASVVACFAPGAPLCGGGWSSEQALGAASYGDCDDDDATVYVGAPETCAPADQDCDGDPTAGAVDATVYYEDSDGDGFGTVAAELCSDAAPDGYAVFGGDCLDQDEDVHPGADDPCGDGVDSDCTGYDGTDASVTPWFPDVDGDGFGDADAAPVLDCRAGAGQAWVADGTDCDDGASTVYPGAVESCNGADDDCDGRIDDAGDARSWYGDADGDGFGDPASELVADCAPPGFVAIAGDCDDHDTARTFDCSIASLAEDQPRGVCTCAYGGGLGGALPGLLGGIAALRRRRGCLRHSRR